MAKRFQHSVLKLTQPRTWSVTNRRIFAVTVPISGPAWLVAVGLASFGIFLKKKWAPVAAFWNAPPARVRNRSYGYTYKAVRSAPVVTLHQPDDQRDAA